MAKAIAMHDGARSTALKAVANMPRFTLLPWVCAHRAESSEIRVYTPITGDWETIASIHDAKGIDAEATAEFVVGAINNYSRMQELVRETVAALENCLDCGERLTWEAEHDAQVVLMRAKKMVGE